MRPIVLFFVLAACNSQGDSAKVGPGQDSGVDTGLDSPADSPSDSPTDSPVDSPADSPVDSPADSPVDSPADSPSDSPADSPVDSALDGDGDGWASDVDCDDADAAVSPGATEVCDGVDNDCDGAIDWGLSVPAEQPTIQAAIDAASEGEHICVAPGTWTERIDFGGKGVWVDGYGGSAVTTLGGAGAGSVVTISAGESSSAKLTGFTVQGGTDATGAGVEVMDSAPTLEDLDIVGNTCTATCQGVGLYAARSTLTLRDVTVRENRGAPSGASYVESRGVGVYLVDSTVSADSLVIEANEADSTGGGTAGSAYGVGLYAEGSTVDVDGLTVAGSGYVPGNEDYVYGVGVYVYGGSWTGQHVWIADNTAYAEPSYGGIVGGGVYVAEAEVGLTNVIVSGNSIEYQPDIDYSWYGAEGGGVYLASGAALTLTNAVVYGNATAGPQAYGGAIFALATAREVALDNVIVMANTVAGTSVGAGGALYSESGPAWSIGWSDLYDNGSDALVGVDDPTGIDGSFAADPLFGDTTPAQTLDFDFQLQSGSPCVDAGDPTVVDADGSVADVGAFGGPGGGW